MRRWSVFRRVVGAACAALVAAACAAPSAPSGPAAKPVQGQAANPPTVVGAPAVAPTARPRLTLRASYGVPIAVHTPIFAAQQMGEWESEGLDVEVQRIATSTSITALLAGDLDVVQVSAPALVSANLQGGADLVFVAGALDRMIINLYAMPGINSAADLRGKTVGTDRPGTPVAFATDLAFTRLGISASDVQLLPIGTEGIVPGMEAQQLVAGGLSHPNSTQALRLGAHLMVPLHDVPYQNVGLIVKRADLDRLAPAMPALLKVYRRGLERFSRDPTWGKEVLAAIMLTTDEALIQEAYEFHTGPVPFTPSLQVSREGLRGVLDSLKDVLPAAAGAQPDQFYDHRFVDQLDRAR
jgi:ABC-type nitrate/sulfonate/bicarbonate transport system substrate-binding protein